MNYLSQFVSKVIVIYKKLCYNAVYVVYSEGGAL